MTKTVGAEVRVDDNEDCDVCDAGGEVRVDDNEDCDVCGAGGEVRVDDVCCCVAVLLGMEDSP